MRTLSFLLVLCGVVLGSANAAIVDITHPDDPVFGLPEDRWPSGESPRHAIDKNADTKYLNFRDGQTAGIVISPQLGTGSDKPTLVCGIAVTTGNDAPDRDPYSFELYGSNGTAEDGPWTLIASGPFIDFIRSEWPRKTSNETPIFFRNQTEYLHYRVMFPVLAGDGIFQIAEIQLLSPQQIDGWYNLFDGKTLQGWTASENKDTFSVVDGMIKAKGPRSHLFYTGPVMGANFKNFELKVDVLTKPRANSGIYFHTQYQETGWPDKGYEVQVNNSHSDWRRTAGLYAVDDVRQAPANDNEWFNMHIIVRDKHIIVKVDGEVVVDYTEPEGISQTGYPNMPGRKISSGTFAIQGHDPGSEMYFKNIYVKPLP